MPRPTLVDRILAAERELQRSNDPEHVQRCGRTLIYYYQKHIAEQRRLRQSKLPSWLVGSTQPDHNELHYERISAYVADRVRAADRQLSETKPVAVNDEYQRITDDLNHVGMLLTVVQTHVNEQESSVRQLESNIDEQCVHIDNARDNIVLGMIDRGNESNRRLLFISFSTLLCITVVLLCFL